MALVLLVNKPARRILCQKKNLDKNKKPMLVSRRIFEGRSLGLRICGGSGGAFFKKCPFQEKGGNVLTLILI